MDSISSLVVYNTDTFNSWGLGQTYLDSSNDFDYVIKHAIKMKANIIVKPSRCKFWYIKGFNKNKTYEEIKLHIESNLESKYKPNSKTWLIKYSED
jgi:hypothetical protein